MSAVTRTYTATYNGYDINPDDKPSYEFDGETWSFSCAFILSDSTEAAAKTLWDAAEAALNVGTQT